MIEAKESLVGNVANEIEINSNINKGFEVIEPKLQEKTATPSEEVQIITPDENYDGLSKITIDSISSLMWVGTQEEYDNLSEHSNNTFYFIEEEE